MGLSASTNLGALSAKRYLELNTEATTRAEEQLASGMRASNPAYDPSSSAVGFSIGATVNTLNQTSRNVGQGQAMIQMASGVLGSTQAILTRMKSLTAQANSDTIGANQRTMIDNEYQQLLSQIDVNANTARWGGNSLLTGGAGTATGLNTAVYSATGLIPAAGAFANIFTPSAQSGFVSGAATSTSVTMVTPNVFSVSVQIGQQTFTGTTIPANLSATFKLDSTIDAGSYITLSYNLFPLLPNAAAYQSALQTFLGINSNTAPATFTSLGTTNGGMPNMTLTAGSGTAPGVWALRYAATSATTGEFTINNGSQAFKAAISNTSAAMTQTVSFANGTTLSLAGFNGTTGKPQELYSVSAGTGATANIQYSEKASDTLALNFTPVTSAALGLGGSNLATLSNAQSASASIDTAAQTVNSSIAQLGGKFSQLTKMADNLKISIQNQTAAQSTFVDANPADALSNFMKYKGLADVASTVLTQALNQASTVVQMIKNVQ